MRLFSGSLAENDVIQLHNTHVGGRICGFIAAFAVFSVDENILIMHVEIILGPVVP